MSNPYSGTFVQEVIAHVAIAHSVFVFPSKAFADLLCSVLVRFPSLLLAALAQLSAFISPEKFCIEEYDHTDFSSGNGSLPRRGLSPPGSMG